jgi:hypothetical protein
MDSKENHHKVPMKRSFLLIFSLFVLIGLGTFLFQLAGEHPERAWQSYLINFLLWSAIAQGGLLFSMVTHLTNARWSKALQGLSESFAAFFPISFVLFLLLFVGKGHIFPWLHEDLHGKEVWLNIPFLFSRDLIGLLVLYGLGFGYLYYALRIRLGQGKNHGKIRGLLDQWWSKGTQDMERIRRRVSVFSVLYILAYALVLTLLAFDLVMSMDPHWISTLFGAYSFVKAFYIGLGALIITAAILRIREGEALGIDASHFHDLGKLFFGFCMVWGDFFYCQFIVIWYGNISEETSYIIQRTMVAPWNILAWTVFSMVFIVPFFILLNRKVKTKPVIMLLLCSIVIIGIWLEHLLVLGPALNPRMNTLPLGFTDGLITLGFLGLMVISVTFFMEIFPETVMAKERAVN